MRAGTGFEEQMGWANADVARSQVVKLNPTINAARRRHVATPGIAKNSLVVIGYYGVDTRDPVRSSLSGW
jgi:hypothetical protein